MKLTIGTIVRGLAIIFSEHTPCASIGTWLFVPLAAYTKGVRPKTMEKGVLKMRGLAVFDIDGTLTDTNAVDDECFLTAVADVFDVDGERLDWSDAPHVTDSSLLEWLCGVYCGRSLEDSETSAVLGRFLELLQVELASNPRRFSPIPGADSVVSRLSAADWEVALATGGWKPSAELKLAAIGFDFSDVAMASASDGTTRTEILQLAVERAGLGRGESSRIVSVGDAVWDVQAASELDWPFVGVGRGRAAEKLIAAGAKFVLPDLSDTEMLCAALESAVVPQRVSA